MFWLLYIPALILVSVVVGNFMETESNPLCIKSFTSPQVGHVTQFF